MTKRNQSLLKTMMSGLLLSSSMLPAMASPGSIISGDLATAAFGTELGGEPLQPSNYAGNVVISMYYTSWCGYCRKAMPDFIQFQEAVKEHGLQVMFINHKEDRKIFREYVRQLKNTSVKMAHDKNGSFGDAYGVESYPHIIVINRAGKVVAVNRGYGERSKDYYINLLSQLLHESATPSSQEVSTSNRQPASTESPKFAKRNPELVIERDETLNKPEANAIIDEQTIRFENPFKASEKK